jgi:HD-GYP domain-containing protein (c-di-GMP phosphodiesterase class II)
LSWRFRLFWGLVLAMPVALFLYLLAQPASDETWGTLSGHFWVVSGTAIAAAVACAVVIGTARSLRETRAIFLGLAFMSIAAIFSVHGLLTPGHIHDSVSPELKISTWLSVLSGGAFIACSALSLPPQADEWLKRNGYLLFGGVAIALGAYVGLSLETPQWLGWVPVDERGLQLAAAALTFALLGFGAVRYYQAFQFARLPSQWAMFVALVMLIEVQMSLTWGRFWRYSWWEYHFLYAGAFAVLFTGWAVEALRAGSLRALAEGLTMRDAVSQLNRGYDQPIADLIDAIELKDLYTLGHVRRVASYALLIGRELRLSPVDLRSLALAAQMHDVGKIGTPDRILTKPGPLTPGEFEVIKEHAERGYQIALNVKTLRPVASAIRHHHEKFDGSGYPLRLERETIPVLSRIVAVADAYDAMTSGRVYQPAVSHEDALAELRRCRGSHFDPGCVDAFIAALSRPEAADLPRPVTRPAPAA